MQGTLTVPDFDCYPITRSLVQATPIDAGVRITWDDGILNDLPAQQPVSTTDRHPRAPASHVGRPPGFGPGVRWY